MGQVVSEDAILGIYRTTIDALYTAVSRRCGGDRDLTEDVVQETWLRAVTTWRSQGLPDRPMAWLTTVSRNLLLNRLRRREPVPLDTVSPHDLVLAVESDGMSESAEVAAVVQRALDRLPPAQSRLIEAFHFDRCSIAQIAAGFGVSSRAVEGRLRRARRQLRRELESFAHIQGELG